MAGEVVVDALPYFDQGYDEPGVKQKEIISSFNKSLLTRTVAGVGP